MQTLKDHFNFQARHTYLDLLILWYLLFLLMAQVHRLEKEAVLSRKPAPPPFRLG
jgi:hypothetical protein